MASQKKPKTSEVDTSNTDPAYWEKLLKAEGMRAELPFIPRGREPKNLTPERDVRENAELQQSFRDTRDFYTAIEHDRERFLREAPELVKQFCREFPEVVGKDRKVLDLYAQGLGHRDIHERTHRRTNVVVALTRKFGNFCRGEGIVPPMRPGRRFKAWKAAGNE